MCMDFKGCDGNVMKPLEGMKIIIWISLQEILLDRKVDFHTPPLDLFQFWYFN